MISFHHLAFKSGRTMTSSQGSQIQKLVSKIRLIKVRIDYPTCRISDCILVHFITLPYPDNDYKHNIATCPPRRPRRPTACRWACRTSSWAARRASCAASRRAACATSPRCRARTTWAWTWPAGPTSGTGGKGLCEYEYKPWAGYLFIDSFRRSADRRSDPYATKVPICLIHSYLYFLNYFKTLSLHGKRFLPSCGPSMDCYYYYQCYFCQIPHEL